MEGKFSGSSLFGKNKTENKMNICTPEDLKSIMARKESLPKCPSWNSFVIPDFQSRSGTATPDGTPQSSPKSTRKLFAGSSASTAGYESKAQAKNEQPSGGWLGTSSIFSSFKQTDQPQSKTTSRSYRNVSNFDINAVSPISF